MGSYPPQTWHDLPQTDTPVSAARLTNLEAGVAGAYVFDPTGTDLLATEIDDALVELDELRGVDQGTTVILARAGMISAADQGLIVTRGNWFANAEQTMDRDQISGSMNATAGVVFLSYFTAQQARTGLTSIAVCTGATPASPAPTLAKVALLSVDPVSGDLTLIAASANDTGLFTVANTLYAKTIAASAVTKGSRYAIAQLQVGSTTPPKLFGCVTAAALTSDAPAIAMQLSGQTDIPATIPAASLTATAGRAWARLS